MSSQNNKPHYALNLKLFPERYQMDIINKRFEIGRKIYNAVLNVSLKRYNKMVNTKEWKINQKKIVKIYTSIKDEKERKKLVKPFLEKRNELLKRFVLNEYSLHNDVKTFQKKYNKNINSHIAQKIASQVWKVYKKILFGDEQKVHFKSYSNPLNSLENKNNETGIVYDVKNNILKFQGLNIKVHPKLNDYEIKALNDKICYCRIVKRFVRRKYKYTL